MIDYYNLPTDDPKVWDIICSGFVKGLFQLEGHSAKSWVKKVLPRNIRELSDLISLVRPGVAEIKLDDKSLPQHYVDRKHGKEETVPMMPCLTNVLKDSYQILLYQEQVINIAREIAGFDLKQADLLRKGIGQKLPEVISKLEKEFIEGCNKVKIINEEDAKQLFEWIRKSQRYLFNLSHSVAYSIIGYWSAYNKTYHTKLFYLDKLQLAKNKIKPKIEIKELIDEAKKFNIYTQMPTYLDFLEDKNLDFYLKNDIIYFGINNIKGIGEAQVKNVYEELSKLSQVTWLNILLKCQLNKTVVTSLVSSGFFDNFNIPRRQMLFDHTIIQQVNDREINSINKIDHGSIREALVYFLSLDRKSGGPSNINRIKIIQDLIKQIDNPPYDLHDDPIWVYNTECQLLGCSLSYNKTDTVTNTAECKISELTEEGGSVLAEVTSIREYTIKNNKSKHKGKPMGAFTAEDETGNINCLIFADTYLKHKNKLYNGALAILTGQKSKDAFIVNHVETP